MKRAKSIDMHGTSVKFGSSDVKNFKSFELPPISTPELEEETKLPEKILRDEFNKALILLPEGMILNFNNGEYQAPTLVAFEKACGIFADKINAIIDYLNSKEGEEK